MNLLTPFDKFQITFLIERASRYVIAVHVLQLNHKVVNLIIKGKIFSRYVDIFTLNIFFIEYRKADEIFE